ncbi:S-adenosylmethionine decarboxylase proenzyme [Selaginella moellendorffii]|nr:S-adenosylmethionine decarboxylase proenzyme [Selaginella moellendorffii]|eukprot:XP_002979516.2 S-adenosylmethionine decarboxylase proenzyme [Selaginella moellendorffii]
MGLEVAWVAGLQQEEVAATVGAVATTGFEGFEKRLEIEFSYGPSSEASGLRSVSREGLDRMLKAAECTIVAQLSSDEFDSYVLSESSLFVYPLKVVIKTCGTTKLLRSIPVLLELASSLDLSVRCCKYRRGSFFFPAEQDYPHRNFTDEVEFLDGFFSGGRGYVLGSSSSAQKWHVYVAPAVEDEFGSSEPSFTLEMCMTELDRKVATEFYKDVNCSAEGMTRAAGIDGLLPGARICDFAFDPCGYSMNSVEGGAYSTIHVTPEDGFSYASFETMGYGPREIDLQVLVDRVLRCFKPGFFSLALYATGISGAAGKKNGGSSWGVGFVPRGYSCVGSSRQELGSGGDVVVYHTFRAEEERSSPSPPSPDWWSSVPRPLAVSIDPKRQELESLSDIKLKSIETLKLKQLVGRLVLEQAA